MVELRSKKSYDVSVNTTESNKTRVRVAAGPSKPSKPPKELSGVAMSNTPAAEVTSPRRRSSRLRKSNEDEEVSEDQMLTGAKPSAPQERVEQPEPEMPPPESNSQEKSKPAAAAEIDASEPKEAVEEAEKEPVEVKPIEDSPLEPNEQDQVKAAPAPPAPRPRQPEPFDWFTVFVIIILSAFTTYATYVTFSPSEQDKLAFHLEKAWNTLWPRLSTLPRDMSIIIDDGALWLKECCFWMLSLLSIAPAAPVFSAQGLASVTLPQPVWQDRISDILAYPEKNDKNVSPSALSILVTCNSPTQCIKAASSIKAAATQQQCVLHITGASFPFIDNTASGRLQTTLAEFFRGCPRGLVVLEGISGIGLASVNVLHNVMSEQGSLLHMGKSVVTTKGAIAIVMQTEVRADDESEQVFDQQAKTALRVVVQQSIIDENKVHAGDVQAVLFGFNRRIDFVLPAAE